MQPTGRQTTGMPPTGVSAPPRSPQPEWAFRVEVALEDGGSYAGDLSGLAQRLRSGVVRPAEVPLLRLTRELLDWATRFAALHPDSYAELLPGLAGVIALKARLLLPAPEAASLPDDPGDSPDDWTGDWTESVEEGVQALEELGLLVQLLSRRRQERQGLIAASRLELGLPRRPGRVNSTRVLENLVKAARNAVRDVQVPLLSVERLTLQDAFTLLRACARRLGFFRFGAVVAQDWGERGTYFSALLEGVRAGEFVTEQQETYGEIVVTSRATPGDQAEARELAGVDQGTPRLTPTERRRDR